MVKPLRVLLIEGSAEAAAPLVRELEGAGFDVTFERVDTAEGVKAALDKGAWDIIVSGYTLPRFKGMEALRICLERGLEVPFIFVSGTIGEEAAVAAVKAGAQDYVLKSNLKRFVPTVERELREAEVRRNHKKAEEALRNSKALYQSLVETLPVHLFCKDKEGRVTFGNSSFCAVMGKTLPELLGKTNLDLCPPDLAEKYNRDDQQVMSSGKIWEDVEQHQIPDGERRYVHVFKVPLRDHRGELIGIQCVFWDITERKRAEEALRQSEERFAKAFRTLTVGVSIARFSDGQFLEVNDAFLQLFGFSREEVVGHTALELGLWANSQQRHERLARLLAEGSLKNVEGKARKKSGKIGDMLLSMELVEMSGEKCILALFTDITERKRADDLIRQQASLLDLAQDAIIVRDLEGRIQFWNKAAERLSGWTAEEVIGRKVTELVYKDLAQFEAAQTQLREKGEWAGELHLVAKGGREAIVSSRWTLVRDAQGNPKSLLAINTDITDKKRLEVQFLRAQRMEGLGLLAGGIAHDLNNILAPILMASELMREEGADAKEIPKMLNMIHVNAQRGADIIKQLLTFGRGTVGKRIIVQPRHLVQEMVKMAQETFPKNVRVISRIADDLWTVMGDATQIHQVLLNLCLNARDAMPGGGTLTVAAENAVLDEYCAAQNPEAAPGAYVLLKVSDSGAGIAPEIIDKIFDPFFTTKEVGTGTGLGLSTVLGIAKSHGGFVKVYSEPGCGSTLAVYLPAALDSVAAEEGSRAAVMPGGQGELILVVDDEEPILELTRKTLERHGYTALTARDGTDALALFAQWRGKIRAVLTDVSMPVMDGITLIRVLKKMEPGVNVIAASGRGSGGKASELKTLGINKFLAKPYAAEKLMMALQELLPHKQP